MSKIPESPTPPEMAFGIDKTHKKRRVYPRLNMLKLLVLNVFAAMILVPITFWATLARLGENKK